MSRARRKPRHRRIPRLARTAGPLAIGGAVAVVALTGSPLGDALRGSGRQADPRSASGGAGADVLRVEAATGTGSGRDSRDSASRGRPAAGADGVTGGGSSPARGVGPAGGSGGGPTRAEPASGPPPPGSPSGPAPPSPSPATSSPPPSAPAPSPTQPGGLPLPLPTPSATSLPPLPGTPLPLPSVTLP